MNNEIYFHRWKKKPGAPGWEEIIVYEDEEGTPLPVIGGRKTEVQCATLERTPFAMTEKNLRDHYERT